MAKVGAALPLHQIPAIGRQAFVRKIYSKPNPLGGTPLIYRQLVTANSALNTSNKRKWETRILATRHALESWRRLSHFKRSRWSVCGIRRFQSGINLYIHEWIAQNTSQPHQPISPCSPRVVNPATSVWNYNP